jgi:chromosomal replication initiation ATPase DnaA
MNTFQIRLSNEIIESVSIYYGIRIDEIRSRKRHAQIVRARHVALYLLREDLRLSLHECGALIGRDHSSVLHAVNLVQQSITPNSIGIVPDKQLTKEIADIRFLTKSTWSRSELDEIEFQIERLTKRKNEILKNQK